jgi:hypothetical protein
MIGFYRIHEGMKKILEKRSTLYAHYLQPLDELNNQFLNATPDDERVLSMIKVVNHLQTLYKTMEKSRRTNAEAMRDRYRALQKNLEELEVSIAVVKGQGFKGIL